jgi:hypothetical protein
LNLGDGAIGADRGSLLFAFLVCVRQGGALDRLAALVQFFGDWSTSRSQISWARASEELRFSGLDAPQLEIARHNMGPLPRTWVSNAAARWLRWRGLLVLYRGQPTLRSSEDFLSPIARGERPFLGRTGLAASVDAANALEAIGVSAQEMCARWDAEPIDLFWIPGPLKGQPLGGSGIPFSEHLPVAAGFAQRPGERVYVTIQRLADSQEAGGWGFSWEAERVALHCVRRETIVISVPGARFRHTDPPG